MVGKIELGEMSVGTVLSAVNGLGSSLELARNSQTRQMGLAGGDSVYVTQPGGSETNVLEGGHPLHRWRTGLLKAADILQARQREQSFGGRLRKKG
jgi:hypothetical protein